MNTRNDRHGGTYSKPSTIPAIVHASKILGMCVYELCNAILAPPKSR
jgi:hypothetical protein